MSLRLAGVPSARRAGRRRVLGAFRKDEIVLVPPLLLDLYAFQSLLVVPDVDGGVQVRDPPREFLAEMRTRRTDPTVRLPFSLGAHVRDGNAVIANHPCLVRVRV